LAGCTSSRKVHKKKRVENTFWLREKRFVSNLVAYVSPQSSSKRTVGESLD
jgi:hypothetical protein